MFDFDVLKDEMRELEEKGLLVKIRTLESPQGAWLNVDGRKVLNMCSNNYLGLCFDEELKQAAIEGIKSGVWVRAPLGPSRVLLTSTTNSRGNWHSSRKWRRHWLCSRVSMPTRL